MNDDQQDIRERKEPQPEDNPSDTSTPGDGVPVASHCGLCRAATRSIKVVLSSAPFPLPAATPTVTTQRQPQLNTHINARNSVDYTRQHGTIHGTGDGRAPGHSRDYRRSRRKLHPTGCCGFAGPCGPHGSWGTRREPEPGRGHPQAACRGVRRSGHWVGRLAAASGSASAMGRSGVPGPASQKGSRTRAGESGRTDGAT